MGKTYALFVGLVYLISSCSISGNTEIAESDLNFSTTDDSELFFVNVRQLYYDLEEIEAAKMKIYRLNDRPDSSEDTFYPVIVWNWMYDEAYILFEGGIQADPGTELIWTNNGQEGSIQLSDGDKMSQLKFATLIYNGLKKNYNFKLNIGEKEIPFLVDLEERDAFRVTMVDYYQLVNIL